MRPKADMPYVVNSCNMLYIHSTHVFVCMTFYVCVAISYSAQKQIPDGQKTTHICIIAFGFQLTLHLKNCCYLKCKALASTYLWTFEAQKEMIVWGPTNI